MPDECPDTASLLKAVEFASRKHSTQRRGDEGDSPYINHPITVTHLLADRHQMTMNGKRDEFTLADFRACARSASMKRGRAESIVDEVRAAVAEWPAYAQTAEVMDTWREQIQRNLRLELRRT